jgi:hypothetical protein
MRNNGHCTTNANAIKKNGKKTPVRILIPQM